MTTDAPTPPARRPRVLIPITILFSVRYVVRTGLLDLLHDDCEPVLALSWDDPDLVAELEAAGYEVARLPEPRVSPTAVAWFNRLEVHFIRRLKSPSSTIDRARRGWSWGPKKRLRRWAAWQRERLRSLRPGDEAQVTEALRNGLDAETNIGEYEAFLADLHLDALLTVTPFVSQEQVLLLAADRSGIACCTSILSFDNFTTRPPLPITFDRYLVWNRFQEDEIHRAYPHVPHDHITLVGPAQFDFYRDPSLVVPEQEWRDRLGLPDGARTVLYGAGAYHVAPWEPQHVAELTAAVDAGDLPADLRIIMRRHPLDGRDRWEPFRDHPAVVFDDPGKIGGTALRPGQVNLDEQQIVGLCSSLAHSDVHVSVSSTMTLDGAFFDKPQVGPAYDASPGKPLDRHARGLYAREHFVPIVASGGIAMAYSTAELVAAVNHLLEDPDSQRPGRERMLRDLCTFTDGACTPRVANGVRAFLATVPPRAGG